jgi:hypothetical protein
LQVGSLEYDLTCLASTVAALTQTQKPPSLKIKSAADLYQWAKSSESPYSELISVFVKTNSWQEAWDATFSVAKAMNLDNHPNLINTNLLL